MGQGRAPFPPLWDVRGAVQPPVLLSKGRAGRDGQGAACSPTVFAFSPPAPRGGLGRCERRAVLATPCTHGVIRFNVCDRTRLVPISKLKTRGTQEGEETLGGASAGAKSGPSEPRLTLQMAGGGSCPSGSPRPCSQTRGLSWI